MPKQRLSSLDIRALACELQTVVQSRLQNIYDLNSRTFVLKFTHGHHKQQVLIESGFRVHLTKFSRDRASLPSGFNRKLRKHLRTRRLTSVEQFGTDRILVLGFGHESNPELSFRLVLEFFAAGNIILVNGNDIILSVLRVFRPAGDGAQTCESGATYRSCPRQQQGFDLTREGLTDLLTAAASRGRDQDNVSGSLDKNGKLTIKKMLSQYAAKYGSALIEHVLLKFGIQPSLTIDHISSNPDNQEVFENLLAGFREAEAIFEQASKAPVKGYLLTKLEDLGNELFFDFHPFQPIQLEGVHVRQYDSFNETVDVYFSTLESQKIEMKISEKMNAAEQRIEAAKVQHGKRIEELRAVQDFSMEKATCIENNAHIVEECINVVTGLIGRGMDWKDIEQLFERERMHDNIIASMISNLNLAENRITLKLTNDLEETYSVSSDSTLNESDSSSVNHDDRSDGELSTLANTIEVEISLSLSAYANARTYFDRKKHAAIKEDKTAKSSKKALKNTERKIKANLNKNLSSLVKPMKPVRAAFWFEKFYWFISSDRHLVLGARDFVQSDILIRKYLRSGDIFVHADLPGACMVVILNHQHDFLIPPSTLSQAGVLSIAVSNAWNSKQVTSAFWVRADQVSVYSSTGEKLSNGNYIIHGPKNYLPPKPLIMGIALIWVAGDEDTQARHTLNSIIDVQTVKDDTIENFDSRENEGDLSTDKYSLDSPTLKEDSAPFASNECVTPNIRKKHVSANERRQLKSSRVTSEIIEPTNGFIDTQSDIISPQIADLRKPENLNPEKPKQQIRGKRGKLNKLKTKYAEQDEEDKEIALKLLGSQARETTKPTQPVPTPKKKFVTQDSKSKPLQTTYAEEIKLTDEEMDVLKSLNMFILNPKPADNFACVIPACAPYGAVGRAKYKIKIQPGILKKGKAARSAVQLWLDTPCGIEGDSEGMTSHEKELIENLKDDEVISCIGMSKIKLVHGGLTKSNGNKGKESRRRLNKRD